MRDDDRSSCPRRPAVTRPPLVVEVTTRIRAPREVVFDLELDVDVHTDSLPGSAERATTDSGRRRLGLGDEVTFSARHFGVRWRMTSRIIELDRPRRFVDEQVRGPFAMMRHDHLFRADSGDADSVEQTVMVDRMSVRAPGGPAGPIVASRVLGPYLRRLLQARAAHIRTIAENRASRE